jgi:EmrB/QacA subfamily drug resistance transporter
VKKKRAASGVARRGKSAPIDPMLRDGQHCAAAKAPNQVYLICLRFARPPGQTIMKSDVSPTKAQIHRVFAGLCLAMFLSALDQTIVATALPTIGVELGDLPDAPWIVTAYLVAATLVTPLYGKFTDIYGARLMMLIAVGIFLLGSVACALSPTMPLLAFARVLQGLGGGGLMSVAQTIVADLVSPRERGRYQTYFAAVFVTSSVAGPLLGGFFAQHWHWSLIFWINLPFGLLALVVVEISLRGLPERRHPNEVDYFGALLLAAAAGLLALALGHRGWTAATAIVLTANSMLFWGLFAWRLGRAREPFIPLSVLANATARDACLCGALGLGTIVGMSAYAPIYFEGVYGLSAQDSGVALIGPMVGTVVGATIAGRLMARLPSYKMAGVVGLVLATMGCVTLAVGRDFGLVALVALITLVSVGVGATLPISTVSVQNAVESRNLGAATAVNQFVRQISCALIVALLGALVMAPGAEALSAAAPSPQAIAALAVAFRWAFAAIALCLALSLLFLLHMEERPLRVTAARSGRGAGEG